MSILQANEFVFQLFASKFKLYFVYLLDRVRLICLPIDEPIQSTNFVNPFVAGWGSLARDGNRSAVLQQI